jgi:hypothetical protein
MIRRPSTAAQLYSWHRSALAGECPAQHDGLPEAGWYRTRLVKGGPFVPVRIFVEREIDPETGELTGPERLACECDGQRRDPAQLWSFLEPISKANFDRLGAMRQSNPAMAATMVAIDLTASPMRP